MTDTQLILIIAALLLVVMLRGTFIQIGNGTIIYQNSDKSEKKTINAIKKWIKKFLR